MPSRRGSTGHDSRQARNGPGRRRPLRCRFWYAAVAAAGGTAMPEHPGVFVEEAPTGARPIEGVGTSTAAFVGATPSGPLDAPLMVHSFAEFQAQFGGLAVDMPLGYAVQHYFTNGGREALIARVVP